MSYQKPNDPMVKVVIAVSSLVLLVAVAILVMSLFNTYQRNSVAVAEIIDTSEVSEPVAKEKKISKSEAAANKNIKPIGIVDASSSTQATASSGPMSGEDVFNATCTACHTPGLLESPKLGDKAAWEPRMANGFDALLASSVAGKGAMPAKGGNASLSDSEMKAAVIYMLEKSGIDAGVKADAPVAEAVPAATEAPATESTEVAAPAATADVVPATEATIAPEVSTAAPVEVTPEAKTAETEIAPVQPTAPAAEVAPAAPEQPAAPTVEAAATSATVETAEPVTAEVAAAPVVTGGSANGEELYKTKCFVCHDAGVAGAPIFGNKEQWAPRIAQGEDVLYNVAMNGKGAMPPKGTANDASEDEIKAAVDYMVSNAQ